MADYSRQRTPVSDLLAFINSQLTAITAVTIDIRTFHSADIKKMYDYLDTIQPDVRPVVVINFPGVTRPFEPQSIFEFSIYVVTKHWGSLDLALAANQDVIEAVYSALDWQLYASEGADPVLGYPSLFYAKRDEFEPMDVNGKNTCFRLNFVVEDY